VISTITSNELAAVSIVPIPSFLASVESTAIGGSALTDILNTIGGRFAVSPRETEHNGVLVRANDLSVGVEH
jgi:hypothetical protein